MIAKVSHIHEVRVRNGSLRVGYGQSKVAMTPFGTLTQDRAGADISLTFHKHANHKDNNPLDIDNAGIFFLCLEPLICDGLLLHVDLRQPSAAVVVLAPCRFPSAAHLYRARKLDNLAQI